MCQQQFIHNNKSANVIKFVSRQEFPKNSSQFITLFILFQATEANLNVNGSHAHTTAELDIQIGDVNDQWPLFYKCEGDVCTETNDFSAEVEEKASAGLSITGLNMRVKDKDVVR